VTDGFRTLWASGLTKPDLAGS